jgi:aryl-alcohol dehydrogenase-like predicted oxidoreductase
MPPDAGLFMTINRGPMGAFHQGETEMTNISKAGTYRFGDRDVSRMGYGAMRLSGSGIFGPPRDREQAIAVLREAVASGVNHIDTSDYYGPHITNQIIREALSPYPDNLVLVTKLGARRGDDASWLPWNEPEDLATGLRDNLRNLGLDVMEVVNLRIMGSVHAPSEGSIARQVEALAELQRQGLIRHLGLSNVTRLQVEEARSIAPVVCVQNHYNLVHRDDDELIDWLAHEGIAYTPFFPLGGFTPLQSDELSRIAADVGATPMQVALAWLLRRSSNILLIPGTSSLVHLRENLAAAELELSNDALCRLDAIGEKVAA